MGLLCFRPRLLILVDGLMVISFNFFHNFHGVVSDRDCLTQLIHINFKFLCLRHGCSGYNFLSQLTVLKGVRQLLLKAATAILFFEVPETEPLIENITR